MGQEREVDLGNWTYSVLLKRTKVKRAKTDVAADETVALVLTDFFVSATKTMTVGSCMYSYFGSYI